MNEKICSKILPHLLTDDQKQANLNAYHEIKEQLEVDLDLLLKVIAGDKSSCYESKKSTAALKGSLRKNANISSKNGKRA